MPLYKYVCPEDRQRFEKLRPISEGATAHCPTCGALSKRVISMFSARVAVGAHSGSNLNTSSAPIGGSSSCACGGNCGC